MPLKENLKNYRLANDFTQQQVADVLGIDRTAYANYELGHTSPSIENLCKLARIFGVSLNELVDFFYDEDELRRKYSQDCSMLFRGYTQQTGYITRDERHLLMLYRLSNNKKEIINYIINDIDPSKD